jgi:hypothetical protein
LGNKPDFEIVLIGRPMLTGNVFELDEKWILSDWI